MKKFDLQDPLGAAAASGPAYLQNTHGVAGSPAEVREVLRTAELAICEMPPGARFGLKGPGASDLLTQSGLSLPTEVNQAVVADGMIALRLGAEEFWIDADGDADGDADAQAHANPEGEVHGAVAECTLAAHRERLVAALDAYPGCILLPRETSHVRLRLTGTCAPSLLARVAQVDLRPTTSPPGKVLQT
jgi:hypothetical protein